MSARTQRAEAFTLVELMIVVAIIAILAMVAIPAFVKYVRRSKTVEATMHIRKIYDSSVAYFAGERAGRAIGATVIPKQFPCSTLSPAPNPATIWCCKQPGGKCTEAMDWGDPDPECGDVWNALNDPISYDSVYYSYQYTSTGTDTQSRFTAHAFGNLDCDDEWSTYERAGSVDSLFNVVGGGGLYINQDIE